MFSWEQEKSLYLLMGFSVDWLTYPHRHYNETVFESVMLMVLTWLPTPLLTPYKTEDRLLDITSLGKEIKRKKLKNPLSSHRNNCQ